MTMTIVGDAPGGALGEGADEGRLGGGAPD
jgi:hypothetical protein